LNSISAESPGGSVPASAATLSAIVFELEDRDLARTLAGALQNLIDPPPEALSVFEADGQDITVPWRITAYYEVAPDPEGLRQTLQQIIGVEIPTPRLEAVPDLNWVALSQAALPAVRAGRFWVFGAHDRYRVPQGPGAILIEAGEAFGTAHHATTYGCLLAIDRLTRAHRFQEVLDLGCGTGVLAIAVARALPGARITASDIDPSSVEVAQENIANNRAGGRISAVCAEGLDHPALRRPARYDLLIANILAAPLIALTKDIARVVRPGGVIVLSGLLTHQAREIIAHYRAAGFTLEDHGRFAGWSTLVLRRC
jgi:ribosomal protein L11 methyltransferase